jgi:Mor family transcriptional regulator
MELAEEIRDRYLNENISMRKLAKEYKCGSTTIFNVINDLTWV